MKPWWRDENFRLGMRDMATVAPGMAAWGLMTGVAIVNSGMSGVEVLMMTLLPYAGSSQLASLPLIAAGAPLWVILATAFCVNLRFIVFSAHLRDYMMDLPPAQRLLRGYVTADLSYMMMIKHWPQAAPDAAGRRQQRSYLAGNCLMGWISWIGASLVGVAFATSIPLSWGLGFAGTLALIGVLFSLANSPLRALSAVVSCGAAVVALALPLRLNILMGIAAAVVLCLVLEQLQQSEPTRSPP